ncbi:hypothetical protein OESDEN_01817 [Oesophagostomum dentatum]|uniref:Uncharacterized protein n=1 Tax=Oesophagostomum dentatum TaxID=61180 RepID=A0A0B1TKZ4_OESDE|nr:hypothetical protein OESDEN_01817 [Oesophagostomum dentatum]
MVKKNLQLTQNSDTSLGFSAFMMANPPIINVMKFYFFNITNQDEMTVNLDLKIQYNKANRVDANHLPRAGDRVFMNSLTEEMEIKARKG